MLVTIHPFIRGSKSFVVLVFFSCSDFTCYPLSSKIFLRKQKLSMFNQPFNSRSGVLGTLVS